LLLSFLPALRILNLRKLMARKQKF
jgi:hypothetical protein